MRPHDLFPIFNTALLPAWALLVLAPRWRWTQRLVHTAVIPVAVSTAYLVLLLSAEIPEGAGGGSLDAVLRMFASPELALVCWIHYLVFDLFVGAWIARDAVRRGISWLLVAPCLVLTLLVGPAGLLLYIVIRLAVRRTATLAETAGG
ncbi:MAG: DUF4281 domain-containing protein [Myxococcales bacterium]|nr:DUF4281 domain-containing protein [Myxococcales bacterium]